MNPKEPPHIFHPHDPQRRGSGPHDDIWRPEVWLGCLMLMALPFVLGGAGFLVGLLARKWLGG